MRDIILSYIEKLILDLRLGLRNSPNNQELVAKRRELERIKQEILFNVSSTNSEQCKLCINSPLYIDTRLLWKQTIGSNGP